MRPFAGDEAQLQAHRLDRQQQVGEDDGGIDVEDLDRLQRDRRGQIRPLAHLEDAVLGADLAVLLQVPAGLPHEPHRPHIGRPAAAGIEKSAVHWSHAHDLFRSCLRRKYTRNPLVYAWPPNGGH